MYKCWGRGKVQATPARHAGGRGFESRRALILKQIA